ncbi:MAG: hypothetical protein QF790_04525 [Gammaproteobacteria bacterium]|jgi:hypothetical protein|nr:hypothetical protein [Gammaproteobacteria bacterium]MDP6616414.1 hypothetical protein [Gammaproteobacteria bacterium]MDP6695744.1 hypothetical protein [Gammaproteobacteria bacterium]
MIRSGFNARLTLILVCLPPLPVFAADEPGSYELTPFASYRFGGTFENEDTGEDLDLDDSSSLGLIFNFPASSQTEWEIYYSRQETDADEAGFVGTGDRFDVDMQFLQVGGTYLFDRTDTSVPFFVATAGVTTIDPDIPGGESDSFLSFSVGGGWKYFPDSRVGVRLEGRILGTFISSNTDVFCQSGVGAECTFEVSGDVLYQWDMQAGIIFRF